MSLSRVETRRRQQENEQKRRKKRRLFAATSLCIVAVLLIILGVFFQGERLTNWISDLLQKPATERTIHNVPTPSPNSEELDAATEESTDSELDESDLLAENTQQLEPVLAEDELEAIEEEAVDASEPSSEAIIADNGQTVQLAFVGDLLPGEYIATYLNNEGVNYPYKNALFHLTSADITAGNLEMPITNVNQPAENKMYVFKGEPKVLSGLVDAGFDIVSLANNHSMDHGVEGLLDTMKHLDEYGIEHVGAGNNAEEAYAPIIREVNGIKIAYVATSRVLPETTWKATPYAAGLAESYDPSQTLKAIEALEEEAHITVVLVHWGIERENTPNDIQLSLAKQYIDAGADLVIGSHPHVLQGFQQYNGKWIAYSLGNFVFSANPKGNQAETGVLTATCNMKSECELQFAPMKVVNAQPTPMEDKDAKNLLKYLEEISIGRVKIDDLGIISGE